MQMRVMAGFLASALALPVFLVAAGGSPGSAMGIATMTGLITLVAGMPVYLVASKRRWLSLGHCLLGGALAAQVVVLPFIGFAFENGVSAMAVLKDLLLPAYWFGVVGAIHGGLFWLVALCGNAEARAAGPVDYVERN